MMPEPGMKLGAMVFFDSDGEVPCPRCGHDLGYYCDVLGDNSQVECDECGAVFTCMVEYSWRGNLDHVRVFDKKEGRWIRKGNEEINQYIHDQLSWLYGSSIIQHFRSGKYINALKLMDISRYLFKARMTPDNRVGISYDHSVFTTEHPLEEFEEICDMWLIDADRIQQVKDVIGRSFACQVPEQEILAVQEMLLDIANEMGVQA